MPVAPKLRLPDTADFDTLLSAVADTPTWRADLYKRITNSYKQPLIVRPPVLPVYTKALLEACANGKPFDVLLDKTIAVVNREFGTHTMKFPNTNIVLNEPALMAVTMSASTTGAVSSNTRRHRSYLCAGNGANIPQWRLLSAVISLNDNIYSVAEDIAQQGPIFICISNLIAIDPSAPGPAALKQLSAAIHRRLNTAQTVTSAVNNNEKHGGLPTIYWPVANEGITIDSEFHLISPVTSTPMLAEIKTRGYHGHRMTLKIGGSKPQNAGLLAMDNAGFIPHLVSVPPKISQRKRANLQPLFAALDRLKNDDGGLIRNNVKVQDATNDVIQGIIRLVIDDFIDPPYGEPVIPTVDDIIEMVARRAGKYTIDRASFTTIATETVKELV